MHLSILVIVTLIMPQSLVYAQINPNNLGLSYQECQDRIGNEMQAVVNSIDKAKAISLATNSVDFQTKVHGFKYVFSNIFTNMTENQEKCGNVKLTSIVVEFSILNSTSNFVKFVQVGEDPTISKVTLVEDVFVQKCNNNCPLPSPPAENTVQEILSPLIQIAGGAAPRDVKCTDDLILVIKAEDDSPACVKADTAQKLIERGWAKIIVTKATSDAIQSGMTQQHPLAGLKNDIEIITLGNKTYYFETPIYSHDAYLNHPQFLFHNVTFTLFPTGFRGGLPIPCNLQGTYQYYWTDAKFSDNTHELLHILVATPPCPTNPIPSMFSNHTNPQAGLTFYNGKMRLLVSNENQTSQVANIIPPCVSKIPHQYAIAGAPGWGLCPITPVNGEGKILNSTGFYGIYNYTEYPWATNFVLEPGHNGTITYLISVKTFHDFGNTLAYPNEFNVTNDLIFQHDAGMHNHPGLDVEVKPQSEMIVNNGSAVITITISASKSALPGNYWATLPSGFCEGGKSIVLTITDCRK